MENPLSDMLAEYEQQLAVQKQKLMEARINVQRFEGAIIAVREAMNKLASHAAENTEEKKTEVKDDEEQNQ